MHCTTSLSANGCRRSFSAGTRRPYPRPPPRYSQKRRSAPILRIRRSGNAPGPEVPAIICNTPKWVRPPGRLRSSRIFRSSLYGAEVTIIHIHSGPAYSQAISLIGSASSVQGAHVPYLPDALSKIMRYDLENLGNKSEGLRLVGFNIPVAGRPAKNLLHCHL
jgi:hypothetical protein